MVSPYREKSVHIFRDNGFLDPNVDSIDLNCSLFDLSGKNTVFYCTTVRHGNTRNSISMSYCWGKDIFTINSKNYYSEDEVNFEINIKFNDFSKEYGDKFFEGFLEFLQKRIKVTEKTSTYNEYNNIFKYGDFSYKDLEQYGFEITKHSNNGNTSITFSLMDKDSDNDEDEERIYREKNDETWYFIKEFYKFYKTKMQERYSDDSINNDDDNSDNDIIINETMINDDKEVKTCKEESTRNSADYKIENKNKTVNSNIDEKNIKMMIDKIISGEEVIFDINSGNIKIFKDKIEIIHINDCITKINMDETNDGIFKNVITIPIADIFSYSSSEISTYSDSKVIFKFKSKEIGDIFYKILGRLRRNLNE